MSAAASGKERDIRDLRPLISPPTETGLYVLNRKYPRSLKFPTAAWVPRLKLDQTTGGGVRTVVCTNCQLSGHAEALCVETGSGALWLDTCNEKIASSSSEVSTWWQLL
eukprot:8650726-Pyramimonas_sp.AAC.2